MPANPASSNASTEPASDDPTVTLDQSPIEVLAAVSARPDIQSGTSGQESDRTEAGWGTGYCVRCVRCLIDDSNRRYRPRQQSPPRRLPVTSHDPRLGRRPEPADRKSAAPASSPLPRLDRWMEHRDTVAVLDQCSVAVDRGGTGRHPAAQRLVADLRKRHQPARARPVRYDQVRTLNPRVRGSSPWRRTRSKAVTCRFAAHKIV
jgi:hypothetical protein